MIRDATPADRFAMVGMGKRFRLAAGGPWVWDAAAAERCVLACIASPDCLALIAQADGAPAGMLLGVVADHPFTGVRFADELVWWVEPEHRGRLGRPMLDAYEAWAEARGAQVVGLADYTGRAGALYRRRGYVAVETHFARPV